MGGVEALGTILEALPPDFPVPILAVQHLSANGSFLAPALSRRTRLMVRWAEHGARLRPETVYFARPGTHMLVRDRQQLAVRASSERINDVMPSADPLFASMAKVFGRRALAVVLTGYGSDGAAGARALARRGGVIIAQDPVTARAAGMPGAVIADGTQDFVLPLDSIAPALVSLVTVYGACELFGLAAA
jgi:two-component system chemotaxis response regulator CheB